MRHRCQAPSRTWPMAFQQPLIQEIFTEHLLHVTSVPAMEPEQHQRNVRSLFFPHPSLGHLKGSEHLWTWNRVDVGPIFQMPLFSNLTVICIQNCICRWDLACCHGSCTPWHKGPVATGSRQAVHLGTQTQRERPTLWPSGFRRK